MVLGLDLETISRQEIAAISCLSYSTHHREVFTQVQKQTGKYSLQIIGDAIMWSP